MGGIRGPLVLCPECGDRICVVKDVLEDHVYYKINSQNAKPYPCSGSGMLVVIEFYPKEWTK